ncbi:MAG: 2-oxoacid:acceptor oxidoreductase subunit alpha [Anaerolineae bacterium]
MLEKDKTVVVRIGGEAGEGTITLGELFTRTAARRGLEIYTLRTYPSEIKGGQVMFQARLGTERVLSEGDTCDVLVAMNRAAWAENYTELNPRGMLIHDEEAVPDAAAQARRSFLVPAANIADRIEWQRGKNLVMVGALLWFFRLGLETGEEIVKARMGRYPDVLPNNLEALRQGYAHARKHYPRPFPYALKPPEQLEPRLLLSGADALALGALEAGCRFYAGYPITPATPVMETMAKYLPAFGGTMIQAEDEIAAINMVIGASFAGKPAMTATSGPGLSLMIEALGLASMAEIPLVVVNVQRAGPSTGLPTKTSQGDLFLSLYGGHGDAPRFVLAPDSIKDCYYQMINAFSLAEYYQMPVIVLSDQAMASRLETMPYPETGGSTWSECLDRQLPTEEALADDYRRYRDTEDGISPMALPGMKGGTYLAESLEHNEYGHPDQSPDNHQKMMGKRARKVEAARKRLVNWKAAARRWGDQGARFGIMGWGSTRGAVREAMELLRSQGIEIEALYPHTLLPMPDKAVSEFIHGKRAILVPEFNFSSQFARMIEHRYYKQMDEEDIHIHMLARERGIPLKIHEIYDAVLQMITAEHEQWMASEEDLVRSHGVAEKLMAAREKGGEL